MNTLFRTSRSISKCLNRQVQTNSQLLENIAEVRNKNPRNLELMTIARKPTGYHLDEPGREYWHKLVVTQVSNYVNADIQHFKNGTVVSASTKEWALKKQLYKLQDVPAYSNLGRVLANRCIECGITSVFCDIDASQSTKLKSFLESMRSGGMSLTEADRYIEYPPAHWKRTSVKPWHVHD